jgi:predicted nucleic-acid-binding protein
MKIVDANFILRYLLNDNEEQANQAYSVLSNNTVYLLNEVIAEIVYVLEKVYRIDRDKIRLEMEYLLSCNNIKVANYDLVKDALRKYANSRLDFIDSILYGYAKIENAEIYTFDKKLINAINE